MATKIALLASILFLAISCTKEVKIDLPEFEQKLVVDGQIRPGIPPIVILSKSQDLYASTSLEAIQGNYVTNAQVSVSDGITSVPLDLICADSLPPQFLDFVANVLGVTAGNIANGNFCAFSTMNTAMFGVIGKTYTLNIKYEDKTYTSTTTLMPPPEISSAYYEFNGKYTDRGYAWIKIKDDASTYNSYFLKEKSLVNDLRFHTMTGPAFDDEFFNGLEFKFGIYNVASTHDDNVPEDMRGYFKVGDTVVVELSSMDLKVYQFNLQKYMQVDNGGNPFAMPANIPTNIEGGALGVWAGYTSIYDTIPCYP